MLGSSIIVGCAKIDYECHLSVIEAKKKKSNNKVSITTAKGI
jgi:hypothetical protein